MDRIAVEKNCLNCRYAGMCPPGCLNLSHHAFESKVAVPTPASAFNRQVGGQHYTDCAIQPFEFSMANKLDPMQHTIIKYVTRFRSKNGIVDLEKAKHTLELLIEWEKNHATQKN